MGIAQGADGRARPTNEAATDAAGEAGGTAIVAGARAGRRHRILAASRRVMPVDR